VPKVMVMGSSSETTINTSTDSSNTCTTLVTVTDADHEEICMDVMENKALMGLGLEGSDYEGSTSPMSCSERSRELLSEFDQLFREHERRMEKQQGKRPSPRPHPERKVSRRGKAI